MVHLPNLFFMFSQGQKETALQHSAKVLSNSNININKLIDVDGIETNFVLAAGDSHEDRQTVVNDIFIREEMELMNKEHGNKPYNVFDLDNLSIANPDDIRHKDSHRHTGIDRQKPSHSMPLEGKGKVTSIGSKDNSHLSYIIDATKHENSSNDQIKVRSDRGKTPDSLDSFDFMLETTKQGDDNGDNDIPSLANPKHLRNTRQPVSIGAAGPMPYSSRHGRNDDKTGSFGNL